jgi:Zn-dependent peptidase ImmA (M78 family)
VHWSDGFIGKLTDLSVGASAVDVRSGPEPAPHIEPLANSFAAAMLMPRTSIHQLVNEENRSDVAHLREVASALGGSGETGVHSRMSNARSVSHRAAVSAIASDPPTKVARR